MTSDLSRFTYLLLLMVLLAACAPPAEQGPQLEPCSLPGGVTAQCGSITVPENRELSGGRQIELHFAIVRAESSLPEPDPIFMLAGGPGQAAMEVYPLLLPLLGNLSNDRDIVLVDQRGTGQSNPLACPQIEELPLESADDDVLAAVQTCRQELAQIADLTQYTTDVAMQDLDEVRQELGYEQINLIGTSYGSRAVLRYMRLFPQQLRSVVLNAVVSHELVLQLQAPADGQRALDLLFARCRADAACAEQFPDFEQTFHRVRQDLAGGREVTFQHPLSGARETVTLDDEQFMQGIFNLLYAPELVSLLPLTIDQIAQTGDYGPLLAQLVSFTANLGTYQGMFFAVVCSEDAALLQAGEAARLQQGSAFPLIADNLLAQCEGWPLAGIAADFRQPLQSDVPALLLSGEADPITPPTYAQQVAAGLQNSRSLTVPAYGHDVLLAGCMPRLVASFIAAASAEDLDTSCLDRVTPPPFFVTPAGPLP